MLVYIRALCESFAALLCVHVFDCMVCIVYVRAVLCILAGLRETPNVTFPSKVDPSATTPKAEGGKSLRKKMSLFSPGSGRKTKR